MVMGGRKEARLFPPVVARRADLKVVQVRSKAFRPVA